MKPLSKCSHATTLSFRERDGQMWRYCTGIAALSGMEIRQREGRSWSGLCLRRTLALAKRERAAEMKLC